MIRLLQSLHPYFKQLLSILVALVILVIGYFALLGAPLREFMTSDLNGLAVAMALGLVIGLGFGLVLGWFGGRAILLKPLKPVLATVHRVAEGDLSARTAMTTMARDDEISRLASEVDRMAEALTNRDRALTDARDRAQLYLDIVGVMVVALNEKGNVALTNRKACEMLCPAGQNQCVGRSWFDTWIPPEDRDLARSSFERIITGEKSVEAEYCESHILNARGRQRLIAWHNTTLHDKTGRVIGVLSAGQDITDLRNTENALRNSRNSYRNLVENIPGAVFHSEIDFPWRVEHISTTIVTLTGVKAEHFIDGAIAYGDLIHPDDLARVSQVIREGIDGRRPYVVEYRLRHQGERAWRWVVERGQAAYGENMQPLWLDGVIADITQAKVAAEERERLQAQLHQAQKMETLGQLTGGIAHDFNNILASILGFAKLSLRRHVPDANSELATYLREVVAASERARDLIARMLAFSRAGPSVQPVTLAAPPLVRETVAMLGPAIPAGIRIDMCFAADLPDIVIDPVDLHQILMNLVINARDAMGDMGRIEVGLASVRIDGATCASCRTPFSGDFLEISVADNGHGISADVLPRIFDLFFTTKATGRGTGMGLATVRSLVQRANGHLLIETATNGSCPGSVFRVFLPPSATGTRRKEKIAAMTMPSGNGRRVLVVDDEQSILHLLGTTLEASGWRVSAFSNPLLALSCFHAAPDDFQAVITDQSMPEMPGTELIRALHALREDLPAILCTGYSEGLDEDVAHHYGIARFLRKPIDMDVLLGALTTVAIEHEGSCP